MQVTKVKTKKRKNTKSRRSLYVTTLTLILLVLATIAYLVLLQNQEAANTSSDKKSTDTTQGQSANNNQQTGTDKTTPSKTTDQIPVDATMSATITDVHESDGTVYFSANVNNVSSDSGRCSVLYTNPNDKPVSVSFSPKVENGIAKCDADPISAQQFSYLGDWTVTFRYYTDNQQAIATGSVQIQ